MKTVLALEQKTIPPSLNFESPNPQIDFANSPFFVNNTLRPWNVNAGPRRAGVSSFGIGGTNAHAIVEEAPEQPEHSKTWNAVLMTVSARSAEAVDQASADLAQYLAANPETDLFDASYTLHVGRKHFAHRRTFVASNHTDAITALQSRKSSPRSSDGVSRPVLFLFSGQGSQYVRMGERLYASDPTFRAVFDQCAEVLRPHLGVDLRESLYGAQASVDELNETWLTQPALFALEYALARMWMHWGITPAAMIGHSIGEYVAACIAGVILLEEALKIVALRGRLMGQMPKGGMLAVPISAERVRPLCTGGIEIAAVNAPSLCTLSGPDAAIDQLQRQLEARGASCRRIHTLHAFHSASMDGILEPFTEAMKSIRLNAPKIPFASNLTGRRITEAEATDPAYWATHLRYTVRFADGLRELMGNDSPILLEVGPGDVLSTFARQSGQPASEIVSSLPHPQSAGRDDEHVLTTLGRLWTAGISVNWGAFHEHERLRRVSLPTYPFERQRYFVEPQRNVRAEVERPPAAPPRPQQSDWFYVPSWKQTPLPATQFGSTQNVEGNWLVFANSGNASAAAVNALADARRIALVNAGAGYVRVAAGVYTIESGTRDHYIRLAGDLSADGYDPDNILHLWNATSGASEPESFEDTGFFSLLFLAQAFADVDNLKLRHLIVVSDGVHAVTGAEQTVPEKALCLAPVKVVPNELPYLQTHAVDLPVNATAEQYREYAANLLLEPLLENRGRIAAYRYSYRWEQTHQQLPLRTSQADLPLRSKGVYLITGGLGGVGLVIARYFSTQARARLVLTTCSPFPERREWESWITQHGEQDRTSRRIRGLLEIEAAGGEVFVAIADIASEPAMTAVLQQTHERFGAINGVVHAAGIVQRELIQEKTRAGAESVLAPKVRGTRVLERLLAPERPDFVILFSSVNAILGAIGSLDYCAANLFLDAFALSPGVFNCPRVISIAWDSWNETGMAVDQVVPEHMLATHAAYLKDGIRNEEGLAALRRIFATSLNQVAVIPRDLHSLIAQTDAAARKPRPTSRTSVLNRGTASTEGFSPTQQNIAEIWQELLGVQSIGLDDNFFELGGHSLLGTSVLSRIRQQYGVALPLRTLFESPTIRELADNVDTLLWASQAVEASPVDSSEEREEIEL